MSWGQRHRGGPALEGVKVMIVDDEPLIAMDLERIVEEAGAEVVGVAGRVDEALEIIEVTDVCAAVLDVRLGGETITPVAEWLASSGVPFVLYSGQQESDGNLTRWACSEFLAKPAPERQIVNVLRRLIDVAEAGPPLGPPAERRTST